MDMSSDAFYRSSHNFAGLPTKSPVAVIKTPNTRIATSKITVCV